MSADDARALLLEDNNRQREEGAARGKHTVH
jgi:hypothetical protein